MLCLRVLKGTEGTEYVIFNLSRTVLLPFIINPIESASCLTKICNPYFKSNAFI
jgi:hypothetical protein